ncbi:Lsr2 family DNA-binding protein [Streptomyces sp. NBC_01361]|uniref:Lsr2 family DNA-binding protein n=1 Tax=Streptomyces sp. NBC_01361 TaxID=2903838 RepID=UPI002E315CB4|nr:histone-like nucleoid-structuring protein Lsr2 [Streptomyces sp. NBC_01361]
MNSAHRAAIVAMLKQGFIPSDIRAELPSVSVGEIAAIAESEGLTRAHTKPNTSGPADIDPQLETAALAALAWGENSHTARIRNLASRTRNQLLELQQLQRDAAVIEAAQRDVAKASQTLAKAQAKLRRLKKSSTGPKQAPARASDDKRQRDEIRSWALEQGMTVSPIGSIPKAVMDAWKREAGKASVPAQRQAR